MCVETVSLEVKLSRTNPSSYFMFDLPRLIKLFSHVCVLIFFSRFVEHASTGIFPSSKKNQWPCVLKVAGLVGKCFH